jgi:hypothetical protein
LKSKCGLCNGDCAFTPSAPILFAEGAPYAASTFRNSQFTLAIDDTEIDAYPRFAELVRTGDTIERYVTFTFSPSTTDAVLRIKVGMDSHAEIPLRLAPTGNH